MFLEPFSIIINRQPFQIGQPLPDTITDFEVMVHLNMQIPYAQVAQVKQWLNLVIERLDCDYVTYNGTLIPTSELQRF